MVFKIWFEFKLFLISFLTLLYIIVDKTEFKKSLYITIPALYITLHNVFM